MEPSVRLVRESQSDKCIIKITGIVHSLTAYELLNLFEKVINGKKDILLDFKESKYIYQFALHILADALKSSEFKGKEIQFSGLTEQEVMVLKRQGIDMLRGVNCFDLLGQEATTKWLGLRK